MEAKHTPGPWSVGRMQRSSNFAKDTYAVQGDGTILCRVKGGVTEDAAIAEANARLIAAAPELLDAARELRTKLLAFVGAVAEIADCGADVDAIKRAEAAIAKAEGLPSPTPQDERA